MRFDNYTPKVFFENFKKDSEVFGEETTQAIYEEIFSALCGKHIKLDSFTEMINEAIDMENEENNSDKPLLTTKQVGRIITKAGIQESAKKLNNAITESVKDEHPKNT